MSAEKTSTATARAPTYPLALAVLGLLLGGAACSEGEMATALDAAFSPQEAGQSVLFVGTDPLDLTTNIYRVRAVSYEGTVAPELIDADGFEVDALTSMELGGAESVLLSEGDVLFTEGQPHPVPDKQGQHFAVLANRPPTDEVAGLGRVGLYSLEGREFKLSPDLPGLVAAHFNWSGTTLVLQLRDDEDRESLALLPVDEAWPETAEGLNAVELASPFVDAVFLSTIPENDAVLARAITEAGLEALLRIDPATGTSTTLLEPSEAKLEHPSLSPNGAWLAVSALGHENNRRQILLVQTATAAISNLGDQLEGDCYWPRWSPEPTAGFGAQLAFVCQDMDTARPDLLLWSAVDASTSPSDPVWNVLTASAQPGVFSGTMDGLVVRSAPLWTPQGDRLVFGASTWEEAYEGTGMTLFGLPLDGSAYPLYSGNDSSVGWAHFSSDATNPSLLVWERAESGLDTESSKHPIRIIDTTGESTEPLNVDLGTSLRVAYPLFAGGNSLFYP